MKPLRVLIVDDEPLAREGLRRLVGQDAQCTIVGEASDGRRAVMAIEELTPDLVLLDVQMPEMDGFEVIRTVGAEHMPAVIFVTAYESYALEAFRVAAVDYLVKPFADGRFAEAIARAKQRPERLLALLEATKAREEGPPSRFVVKTGDHAHVVRAADVDWIEAADYCARLHVGKAVHVIRASLSSLEQQLDARAFFRLHRSAIVNLDRVRRIEHDRHGDAVAVLADDTRLRMTRGRRTALEAALGRTS